MKALLPLHLAWGVVAIAAFVIGSKAFPTDSAEAEKSNAAGRGRSSAAASGRHSSDQGRDSVRRGRAGSSAGKNESSKQLRKLSDGDIQSLGKLFQTERDPIQRRLAFSKLIAGLTLENAELMREQIVHLHQDSPEFREFHYAWGALAKEAAVIHGMETPKRDMAAALAGWASSDPQGARAWFDNLPDDQKSGRRDLQWGVAYGLANTDPSSATDFVISRLEVGDKHASRMIHIVADSILRSGDPEDAAQWSQSLPEGKLQSEAIGKVAQNYAQQNPGETVNWLQTLPDSGAKSRGLGTAYSVWAGRDPEAATSSLNKMPESPSRDSAVVGFARRIVHTDPQMGVEWASSISDAKTRNRALIDTGRVFLRRDPEAAKQWINNGGLPTSVQKHLIPPKK
ncbi:MAG: hypothetical protein ACPG32_14450 [Akkermansiaceae bacterium]